MKNELNIEDSKFIYAKNELSYQEILDEMKTAKKIVVVTFNISKDNTSLIDCLRETSDDCDITMITNIPQRWDNYRTNWSRSVAHKQIRIYLSKLNPEKIGQRASVFFNFSNHGKIIMTEDVAYIGSANFSEESSDNIEFGIISRDKRFISFLLNDLIPDIVAESEPYYEYDFLPLLLECKMATLALYKLLNELCEQAYFLHDDIDGKGYIFNTNEDIYSTQTCTDIIRLLKPINHIASDIYDAIAKITNDNENKTDEAAEIYDTISTLSREIESLLTSQDVWDLFNFDINIRANSILQNEYSLEAYDEMLQHYAEKAFQKASDEFCGIAQASKNNITSILKGMKKLHKETVKIYKLLKAYELRKTNPKIDNT